MPAVPSRVPRAALVAAPDRRRGDRLRGDPRRRRHQPPVGRDLMATSATSGFQASVGGSAARGAVVTRGSSRMAKAEKQIDAARQEIKAPLGAPQGRHPAVDHRGAQPLERGRRRGRQARRGRPRQEGPGDRPRAGRPGRDRARRRVPLGDRRLPRRREARRRASAAAAPTAPACRAACRPTSSRSTRPSARPSRRSRRTAPSAATASTRRASRSTSWSAAPPASRSPSSSAPTTPSSASATSSTPSSIWSVERGGEGWRGMSDRGSTTANHYDHVHVTTY